MSRHNREENNPSLVIPSEEEKTEPYLIEAAQEGDKKAFGQLIRRYQKRLFRFVYGLVGSFDTTEDIVQEAFIKAYRALGTFKAGYDFYPWLSTIARNTAFNSIRRDERKESLDSLQEKGYDTTTTELGPLEQLLDSEGQYRFYKAVKALPVKYRTVFVLRHFENMGYTDIAASLKIPPGTVDSRLYRARKLLLEELNDLL
ncbi:MAG: sigma-70 family RNA polymerase sigma factor [candidate division Zixibacteria bacterium]|nr:sigma-70 family RNA polymerase sigma factor [candidate division Zixibacteria bacterium]